ncbi:hypothetical protein ABZV91_05670 [Nocardia sp. NPDC004568]|uniref:hypothetical protein n=1 Tax=Nocardia sp. NPDC004568 TaxID=3154551 RepID=UPI0033A72347
MRILINIFGLRESGPLSGTVAGVVWRERLRTAVEHGSGVFVVRGRGRLLTRTPAGRCADRRLVAPLSLAGTRAATGRRE